MADRGYLKRRMNELVDQDRLIEAGWVAMRIEGIEKAMPLEDLESVRQIFFAGAAYLMSTVMTIRSPDHPPTDEEMRRLGALAIEVEKFQDAMEQKVRGHANEP
jgi:hypothetical protein